MAGPTCAGFEDATTRRLMRRLGKRSALAVDTCCIAEARGVSGLIAIEGVSGAVIVGGASVPV